MGQFALQLADLGILDRGPSFALFLVGMQLVDECGQFAERQPTNRTGVGVPPSKPQPLSQWS